MTQNRWGHAPTDGSIAHVYGKLYMFFGFCKKDEYIKFKTEIAEHNKIHTECIEKYNTINNRLRDMERIY